MRQPLQGFILGRLPSAEFYNIPAQALNIYTEKKY